MGTADTSGVSLRTESLDARHWVGVVLALVTAGIHLLLGGRLVPSGQGIAFLLAGLGFLGAITLLLLDYRRETLYAVGIPYTALQIVLWYILNFAAGDKSFPADIGALGAVDKVAQVALIAVLVLLWRDG